jgi:dihydrolipoamide dehydrogenase
VKTYDCAIIGSGPGGYVAALYASRFNLTVCVIEKGLVGGVCLNRGCIPTKTLINTASIISEIKEASRLGVSVEGCTVDFAKVMMRKDEVVVRLRAGIETLFRARKIDLVRGIARITGADAVAVEGVGEIKAKNIIIATGSRTSELPGITIDETNVLSSDGILDLKVLPKSMAIIGGGVVGCEFAGLFNTLGVKVAIVELTDRLITTQSREASKKLEAIFKKRGIDIHTASKVESIKKGAMLAIMLSGGKAVEAEKLLVSVGRVANIDHLGLENVGIRTEKGKVRVDDGLRTSVKSVYAIGDCVSGPLLAHKASYDAILAVDDIRGDMRRVDYSNIPSCIWTDPEIASVGFSDDDAKARYPDVKIAKFPYLASGKAFIEGKTEGYVKIIGTSNGEILGVEIFGKGACDLIGEAVLARTSRINIKDWCLAVHGHPTLSEMLQEAAHVFCGTPIHSV